MRRIRIEEERLVQLHRGGPVIVAIAREQRGEVVLVGPRAHPGLRLDAGFRGGRGVEVDGGARDLHLYGADYLSAFTKPQLDALAVVSLRFRSGGAAIPMGFWGLWLFPFGLLVYRSGFIPRILGVLLIINCFAYVIPSFTVVLLPRYKNVVDRIALPFLLGEAAIVLWLLIKGARDQPLGLHLQDHCPGSNKQTSAAYSSSYHLHHFSDTTLVGQCGLA